MLNSRRNSFKPFLLLFIFLAGFYYYSPHQKCLISLKQPCL